MDAVVDVLERPLYTMSQVDRLLGLPHGTARRWIDGYSRRGRDYRPIVRETPTGADVVTWGEFVETRLLSEFRDAGVPILNMRPAIEALRAQTDSRYPLAHSASLLTPMGKELVKRIQDEVHLDRELQLVVVRNGQYMLTPPAELYVNAMQFDDDGAAVRMLPDPEYPQVLIDPARAFGEPAVRSVPTEVIAEQVRAGDPEELVAELYDLPLEHVRAAVRFEQRHSA
ncbi:DUF433 domain-containing protein [Microbispora amethystogenes]|uniref:Putative antitoxin VapB45-like DNA-binding HTH domain-containing protein n=1 Tax=Microbispora amethystogenes TaxID=1427754 RepID=A0ABQ4FG71_9ACTN|nr:DUF433 domain-containing protein [Microbispora amethystogenes]GIH33820.1 hypothetical protein Mam01_39840 [Microbispora amethystogenes]